MYVYVNGIPAACTILCCVLVTVCCLCSVVYTGHNFVTSTKVNELHTADFLTCTVDAASRRLFLKNSTYCMKDNFLLFLWGFGNPVVATLLLHGGVA
jgi:hypothetical protein